MGWLRARSHRIVPLQMLIFGLILIGCEAYFEAGPDAAEFAVKGSLWKLLIQVPAGIVAVWIAARLIDFDFGTIGVIALKIAGITVLAEGVACWIPTDNPMGIFLSIAASLTVMLVGFFWLFELSKWETYLIVLLNFVVLFGAHYLLAKYVNKSQKFGERPPARGRRLAAPRSNSFRERPTGTEGLIPIE
jgi:hypothetical protein